MTMARAIEKIFDAECAHLNGFPACERSPGLKASVIQYEDGGRGIVCPRMRENFEDVNDVCLEIFRERSKQPMENFVPCSNDHCVFSASYEECQEKR
jgi:hypothetical protein